MNNIIIMREIVEEKYKEIKEKSTTYGELKRNYKKYAGETMWRERELGLYIEKMMDKMFEEDLGNAKI